MDEIGQAAKAKDFLRMDTADQEFHQTIWRISGNPYLYKILSNLLSPYFGFLASKGYYFRRKQLKYCAGGPPVDSRRDRAWGRSGSTRDDHPRSQPDGEPAVEGLKTETAIGRMGS